jgi:predicted phosphodiesterase
MSKSIRFTALFLILCFVVPLLGCNNTAPTPAALSDEAYFAEFQPVLRFAALSDSHIDDQGTELEEQRLVKVLQTAKSYGKLDAVLVAGDFVDYGTLSSMEKFKGLLDENLDADTKAIISLGNHEYYVDKENTAARFESVFGAPINEHAVINGFHFIKISPDESGNAYAPATLSWLETELAAAAAEDAAKPIFVMQHHAVKNTLFLSDYTVAVDTLHPILSKYPQVVDFPVIPTIPCTTPGRSGRANIPLWAPAH